MATTRHVPSPFASQTADLHDNGCAVVVASGNSYYNYQKAGVSTPSADPNAWSVGAVWDRDVGSAYWYSGAIDYVTGPDHITSFSQRGPGVTTILAPGGAITGANWNGGTITESGTSQAAPHIAGLVADMQQLAQQVSGHLMSVDDLRDTMVTSGVKIYDGKNGNDNEVHTYGMYACGRAGLGHVDPQQAVRGDIRRRHVERHRREGRHLWRRLRRYALRRRRQRTRFTALPTTTFSTAVRARTRNRRRRRRYIHRQRRG
jgi:hypothetical protein